MAEGQSFERPMMPPEAMYAIIQRHINESVDRMFEGALSSYDLDTMQLKCPTAAKEHFDAIGKNVNDTIGELCKMPLGIPKLRYKRKLVTWRADETKKLSMIWEALRNKVQALAIVFVDYYMQISRGFESLFDALVDRWGSMHADYLYFIRGVSPLLEYVAINYPSVAKEVTRDLKVTDYFEVYLINLLRQKLSGEFQLFLQAFLSYQRQKTTLTKADVGIETPLTLMYRYRVSVNDELTLKDFYLDSVNQYAQNDIHIENDSLFCETLTKCLARNALITGTISAMLIQEANEILLQNTLMKDDTVDEVLEYLKDRVDISSSVNVPTEVENQVATILAAFDSRSMLDHLEKIYGQVIRSTLIKSSQEGVEDSMRESSKLVLLARGSEWMTKVALKEIEKIFGGPINVIERYLRLCVVSIRKCNQEIITQNPTAPYYGNALAISVPSILNIPPRFLDLYSRSLFRRFIMHGPTIIETIKSPRFLEYHLIALYRKIYAFSPEIDTLETLTTEITNSSSIARRFAGENSDRYQQLTPLIFEKSKVPLIFQESAIPNNIALTGEMQESWDELVKFYRRTDKRAQFKKLYLIDNLQHCEVETQFGLNNGEHLVLDLTFYQTHTLLLFNDGCSLTFADLLSKSQLDSDALTGVLRSFLNIGLLIVDNDQYSLNDSFTPDEGRIRNGLLRVRMDATDGKQLHSKKLGNALHMEGQLSYWKQELIRACVVRSLKGEEHGLKANELFAKVRSQIYGTSVGEFKDALRKTVGDKIITKWKNCYKY